MQATTGAWAALPDIPWQAPGGAGYRELGAECARVLRDVEAGYPGADAVGLALLAERVTDLAAALRDLADARLPVQMIFDAGGDAREAAMRRGRHLRPVPGGHAG